MKKTTIIPALVGVMRNQDEPLSTMLCGKTFSFCDAVRSDVLCFYCGCSFRRNVPRDPNWVAVSEKEIPTELSSHLIKASELEFIKIIGSGSFGVSFIYFIYLFIIICFELLFAHL